MNMPRAPQKYHAIDEEQGIHESIIQAQHVESLESLESLELDATVINGSTPQPTRKSFITKVYSILWAQLVVTSIFIGCCNQIQPLQTLIL